MTTNVENSVKFPENFLLGVGTSAYQVEGGWDADGKSPNIWDHYFHSKANKSFFDRVISSIKQNVSLNHKRVDFKDIIHPSDEDKICNGDITCNSYNLLDEDIKNLVDLKVNIYRFSISWSRVLPNGDIRTINEKGVQYYKNLIQKLLDNNIQPMVTMYHWDLPNVLQELGGWTNSNMVEYYKDYVTFLFETFGDQVKIWCTVNEPRILSVGYSSETMAPGIGDLFNGFGDSMSWRNLLLGHAAAYKVYKNSFKDRQKGEITITVDTAGFLPLDPDDEEHQKAASNAFDYNVGVFLQPLINGEFPKSVIEAYEKTNKEEPFNIQRLVPFTKKEKEDLIGSFDFLGFNYYFSVKVKPRTEEESTALKTLNDKDMDYIVDMAATVTMEETFEGFGKVIKWLRDTCNDPVLFVTENGYNEKPNVDTSSTKIKYHHGILTELYKSMEKGAKIKGYTVWSFMDSLEWALGYNDLYGVLAVDFTDEKRTRSEKPSTDFFRQLFKTKSLPAIDQLNIS